MNVVIENCDIYEEMLYDIIQIMRDIAEGERTFKENNRLKNILDDLDNFNITMQLCGVDTIRYTMLLSMKDINIELINETDEFEKLPFSSEEDENVYNMLIKQFKAWREILTDKYEMPEELIAYIQPNSRLVNLRLSCSIKELMYFINSCAKYNELIDIVVMLSEYDGLMDRLVSVSNLLNDIVVADDLFIRMMLDPDNRNELLTNGTSYINIVSNEEYLKHCINAGKADVKISSIGSCSLVAYREIVRNIPKLHIKVENFLDIIKEDFVSITLPKQYCELPDEIINGLGLYIQDWYELSNKLSVEEFSNEKALCYLGCYLNIFKLNTMIENYFRLASEASLSEVSEIMLVVEQKLIN